MSKLELIKVPTTKIVRGKVKIRCEHCGQYETEKATIRYHGDRCKLNPDRKTAASAKAFAPIGEYATPRKTRRHSAAPRSLKTAIAEAKAAGHQVIKINLGDETRYFKLVEAK